MGQFFKTLLVVPHEIVRIETEKEEPNARAGGGPGAALLTAFIGEIY